MAAHRKDLDDSTIIDLYLQGKSSTEIAKQFGTSHRTILLRLKLYEIAVKDKELNNPNNLITVCSMCHHKIHGQL